MTKLQLDMPSLTRQIIGFDRLFHEAERKLNTMHYPPHNIVKIGEDEYIIELAVAGFGREELDVRYEDSTLTVSGKHMQNADREYIYQGIGYRNFIKNITLTEYIEVVGAELKDGLLLVKLERIIPDELKAKTIKIN